MIKKQQEWLDNQCLISIEYLKLKGFDVDGISVFEKKYLMPLFLIWKFTLLDGSQCWVIGGDLPVDHANGDVAFCTREAVHHFSLKWQLQAQHFLKADVKEQNILGKLLNTQAKILFQIYNDESLWVTS
jgi:hypothetical protein